MSPIATPLAIRSVSALIREGDFPAARRVFTKHMTHADEHDRMVIIHCAQLLQTYPGIGVDKLRQYWRASDERARVIIEACAPHPGEQRPRPEPAPDRTPRWNRRTLYQAPSTVTESHGSPQPSRTPARAVRAAREAEQYHTQRAGIDDTPAPHDEPAWGTVDHDHEILRPLRGLGCVALGCNLELTDADRRHGDWLCAECREIGRPGIDTLPTHHTRTQAIEHLCRYLWTHYPRPVHRMRSLWKHTQSNQDRATITAWVTNHTPQQPDTPTTMPGACAACGDPRTLRDLRRTTSDDGHCAPCRAEHTAPHPDNTHPLPTAA